MVAYEQLSRDTNEVLKTRGSLLALKKRSSRSLDDSRQRGQRQIQISRLLRKRPHCWTRRRQLSKLFCELWYAKERRNQRNLAGYARRIRCSAECLSQSSVGTRVKNRTGGFGRSV